MALQTLFSVPGLATFSMFFLCIAIGCKGHGNDGHSHEQSNIVGRKTDRGLNIVSNSNENPPSSKPIKCSICSSMAPDNLTPEQRKQINPVGQECIDSPEKFIRDCDEWRSSLLSERPFGSINRTVHFTGCYKSTFTYDYDFEGREVKESRTIRKCGFLDKPGCGRVKGKQNQYSCFCKESGCNSGFTEKSSIFLVTIISLLAIHLP